MALWWRLVRFGFRLLYNEMAWTYDLVSWGVSLGHWREWQRASLAYLNPSSAGTILELAHGTADLQIDLAGAGRRSIGLDLSPNMGRIAQRKLKQKGLTSRLVRASAGALPFAQMTFPAVVATFPTEFIFHADTISEIYRVLDAGGRLVVVLNGMLTIANPLVRLLEWLYRITGQRGPWPQDPFRAFSDRGFVSELHVDELPGGKVWVLVAIKT